MRATSTSSSLSENEENHQQNGRTSSVSDKSRNGRKGSIYEQKQVEVPTTVVGNRIASRTQNLFKQYEKDMTSHEIKPLVNVNADESSGVCNPNFERGTSTEEKTKVDLAREEKEKELEAVRRSYQERLAQEEEEEKRQRKERIQNQTYKSCGELGKFQSFM